MLKSSWGGLSCCVYLSNRPISRTYVKNVAAGAGFVRHPMLWRLRVGAMTLG